MADNKNNSAPRSSVTRKLAELIQANMNNMYRTTYYADPVEKNQLDAMKTDINQSIKNIMDNNMDNIGEPNISKLYERLFMTQNSSGTVEDFEKIFSNTEFINNLTGSYLDTRWIKYIDEEINEIVKYMPKLQEALNTLKDNVLSSDSFSKDYLSLESHIATTTETQAQFARNIEDMKERYEALKLTSEIYDKTSKYGETFVYCVPYTKAINRLLERRNQFSGNTITVKTESTGIIIESADVVDSIKFDNTTNLNDFNINLNIELENGIISSIVEKEMDVRDKRKALREQSLSEQFIHEVYLAESGVVNEEASMIDFSGAPMGYQFNKVTDGDLNMDTKLPVHHKFNKTLDDDMPLPKQDDTTADGLYTKINNKPSVKDMNGCIVKILKRDKVHPITLNDINLGYFYIETDITNSMYDENRQTTGLVNTITGLRSNGRSEAFDSLQRREELLRSVASNLATRIDANFVNANQDLKREIYYILKYSDDFNNALGSTNNIRVSYIPPDDIHHIYFNLDEDTGRGISDLQLSLVPAKLWVAIYITNCLGIMTRGNDKRVYYVKQSVESNISKTLLKTINEIKKSNFGIRQIENINSVLNITGRFNDYIIPRGADGQSPIEFEVMPGQQIDIKTDLLELLEESAINSTGVPIEIIQNRQSPDYAMQLTMSNSKFLRFVYSRQGDFQKCIEPLFTKIYDIEYSVTDKIKVTLPPPLFINVTNTNQLIMNTSDYCDNIVNIVMGDENDENLKAIVAKNLKLHHLGSYLNVSVINDIINKSKQELTKSHVSNPENIEQ